MVQRLVILTGSGISAESGLATFRDPGGIWQRYSIDEVATPEAFARDPALVYDFYNHRRRQLAEPVIAPNAAHKALAELEASWPGEFLLITQNVDDLHERAGSRALIHMHGELRKLRCLACGTVNYWDSDADAGTACPHCSATGRLRPHIVWFGEMPMQMDEIYAALSSATLFISIGTSGVVYPAAQFVAAAKEAGAHTVELNLEPSAGAGLFDESAYGPASQIVPRFCRRLLEDG